MSGIVGGMGRAAGMGGMITRRLDDAVMFSRNAANRVIGASDEGYLRPPHLSRSNEVTFAFRDSEKASRILTDLKPSIAQLDASIGSGDDGVRLAKEALDNLDSGRTLMREGIVIEDDILRGGNVHSDPALVAGAHDQFKQANSKIQALADIARAHETPLDALTQAVINRSGMS